MFPVLASEFFSSMAGELDLQSRDSRFKSLHHFPHFIYLVC